MFNLILEDNSFWSKPEITVTICFLVLLAIVATSTYVYCNIIKLRNTTKTKHVELGLSHIQDEPYSLSNPWQQSLRENADNVDLAINLKDQLENIPYNTKREIGRNYFEIGVKIGNGNFGTVNKGILFGLYESSSKTTVAIKSVNGLGHRTELNDLMAEIKLMSYIDPHPNLVSLIGSCSSELKRDGNLWLLIEFCEHGDLQNYLKKNESKILSGKKNDPINSRSMLKWLFEIAKGMQYLEENKIMHGDLAARNILMADDPSNTNTPVAKVADFGLAKNFYDNATYEKARRELVPWKWMALEYLEDSYFTLKSDVWSYGVLLWEIMAFGRPPYGQQTYDEVLTKLKSGSTLTFPNRIKSGLSWSPKTLYDNLSKVCFIADPDRRCSFSEVVQIIQNLLSKKEKSQYRKIVTTYRKTIADLYLKNGMK